MTRASMRSAARQLIEKLPELPQPWCIETLCQALERTRGRQLRLHPISRPSFPSGLWHDDGTADHIFYRASAKGYYRDHIILHEICHILEVENREVLDDDAHEIIEQVARAPEYSNETEELAETFSSMVLTLVERKMRHSKSTAIERRVGDLFGVTGGANHA
ncbi:hypothetical protein ABZY02_35950 [Streptomyces sp. NPDC006649]|uniref:hypothetical protein n=1 Tax=Streptomyces sp. NPDC006649 TaxID=3156896 RepID=UPI0033ACCAE1